MKKLWFCLAALLLFSSSSFATVILVADFFANKITAYELSTGDQLGAPFPINEDVITPLGLATNPDKTVLYVSNRLSGEVNIYDLSTGIKLQTLISGISNPTGITLNSTGTILYVASFSEPAKAYDAATGAVIQTYTGAMAGGSDTVLSPDGSILYIPNIDSQNVYVYNPITGVELISPIAVSGAPSAVAVSLNGEVLYVCTPSTNKIATYNATNGAVIQDPFLDAMDGLDLPNGMSLSEDGTTLYVGNWGNLGNSSVLAFNSSTGTPVGLPFPITMDIMSPAAFAFVPSPVLPPANLSGYQKKDSFALEYELFNQLTWTSSPSAVAGYYVYRNGDKIATLNNFELSYKDHNREKGIAITYSVIAFDQVGTESDPITCVVK